MQTTLRETRAEIASKLTPILRDLIRLNVYRVADTVQRILANNLDAQTLVRALRECGATALPLLAESARAELAAAARKLDYATQPEAVGPPERRVRQRLASCQPDLGTKPFAGFAAALEALLERAHAQLSESPWARAPRFNDWLVQRYPPCSCAISPHLDGKRFVDLVAVAVLAGEGRFCLCQNRAGDARVEIAAPPGSVIFMRAPGFDGAADGRPFHCVTDIARERYTIGLRHDSRLPPRSR